SAVVNYLGRLGWSLDDKTEFIPLEQMIANFGLERVNDSPARFDPDKLYWLAGGYMRLLPVAEKVNGCIPFLQRAGTIADLPGPAELEKLERVLSASGDRIKLFSDVLIYGGPFFRKDPIYDEKAVTKKLKKAGAADVLRGFVPKLQAAELFDAPTLEKMPHEHWAQKGLKAADPVPP